jgi:sugar/nucleoside kinase (ribokinase family)
MLVDATSEHDAVTALLDAGVKEIVIKRGAEGATYVDHNQRLEASPLPVTEIDPTGAGDCFGAAYVACRSLGFPALDSLHFANAAGALAVTQRGPMEGASTFTQLREILAIRDGEAT